VPPKKNQVNKNLTSEITKSFLQTFLSFFLSFFALLAFELRAYTLSHSTSPFFLMGFFSKIRSHKLLCLGWLWTAILLISASRVARIIIFFFFKDYYFFLSYFRLANLKILAFQLLDIEVLVRPWEPFFSVRESPLVSCEHQRRQKDTLWFFMIVPLPPSVLSTRKRPGVLQSRQQTPPSCFRQSEFSTTR
jgi:hypothetical protein